MKSIGKITLLGLAISMAASTPALATGSMAMAWSTYQPYASPNSAARKAAWNAMQNAQPAGKYLTQIGCEGACNAYQGDTNVSQLRSMLCFVPGTDAEPALFGAYMAQNIPGPTAASSDPRFYLNWSGGTVFLTGLMAGSSITSRADGDQKCRAEYAVIGAIAGVPASSVVWAEHHMNGVGGWGAVAVVHPNSKFIGRLMYGHQPASWNYRFWTAIEGQPANPWNP